MINIRHAQEFCKDDLSEIENYDKAISDKSSIWHCHHKAGIDLDQSRQQLMDDGHYLRRPANELVFLPAHMHLSLHQSGSRNNFFGHHHTDETKKKISQKMSQSMIGNTNGHGCKGKPFTERHKENIKVSKTGCKRYNDGSKNYFLKPEAAERLQLAKGWIKTSKH